MPILNPKTFFLNTNILEFIFEFFGLKRLVSKNKKCGFEINFENVRNFI